MYCTKCGAKLEDGAVFCPNCGQKVEEDAPVTKPASNNVKKPVNKKAIIIVSVIVAVLAAGAVVFGVLSSRVDAGKYINDEISFSGDYSGSGTVDESDVYDYSGLSDALGENKKTGYALWDEINDELSDPENYIEINLDKQDGLKNGDVVKATIVVDYDTINSMGFKKKLVGKENYVKEYTVSGLEEPTKIDPFGIIKSVSYNTYTDETEIEYDTEYKEKYGDFTAVYMQDTWKGEYLSIEGPQDTIGSVSFSCSTDNYATTNEITVTAIANQDTNYFTITPETKEFTPKIIKLLENVEDLNADDYNALKDASNNKFYEYDGSNHNNPKFYGAYLMLYTGESLKTEHKNRIVFIYQYDYSDDEKEYDYYYYENVTVNDDGSVDSHLNKIEPNSDYSPFETPNNYINRYKKQGYTVGKIKIEK